MKDFEKSVLLCLVVISMSLIYSSIQIHKGVNQVKEGVNQVKEGVVIIKNFTGENIGKSKGVLGLLSRIPIK